MAELRNMKVAVADEFEVTEEIEKFLQREHTFAHKFNDGEYILHINIASEEDVPPEVVAVLQQAENEGFEYVCFYLE